MVVGEEDSVEAAAEVASGVEEETVEAAVVAVDVVDLVAAAEAVNATTATKRGTLQENALKEIVAATDKQKGTITKSTPVLRIFVNLISAIESI